jgi:hypothetical protein
MPVGTDVMRGARGEIVEGKPEGIPDDAAGGASCALARLATSGRASAEESVMKER